MLEVPLSLGHIEWRLAATAEARRQLTEAARARHPQRRFVVGLFVAAVSVAMILAVSAYAMLGPYVRASIADRQKPFAKGARRP